MKACWLLVFVLSIPAWSQTRAMLPYAGRWDLTITTPQGDYPSWIEVSQKDNEAVVLVVSSEGALHGSANVKLQPEEINTSPSLNAGAVVMGERTVLTRLYFTTLEKFNGKFVPVQWELGSAGGKLTGKQKRGDGVTGDIKGEHAPLMKRKVPSKWGTPVALLSQADLSGWSPIHGSENHWAVEGGVLKNASAGADLKTANAFDDFKLHLEFNCAATCDSGVALRGRYLLRIQYGDTSNTLPNAGMGSILGYLAPSLALEAKPGTWESFDVTLVGRNVTVLRNGTTIIDNKPIPGITGGALDSHEAEPGPFYLLGSAGGAIQFRNITVSQPAS